jgi:hypothetical protein
VSVAQDLLSRGCRVIEHEDRRRRYDPSRVSTLFVACNTHQWGTFDPQTQAIQVVQEAALAQEDLLDCAALHTFLNSGTVYAVPTDHVPAAAPLAAVLRY